MGYASRTGTRRNLDALRVCGWRLIVSARGALRTEGMPYALDNGAWTSYQRGEPFDADAFQRALELLGENADWVVLPDIVMDGLRSLEFLLRWLHQLRGWPGLFLLAVQDGMTLDIVRPLLSANVGIFVGGSTEWKEATMCEWGGLAHDLGCYLHVGRVNTQRRIRLCAAAGADSFDGTSASRYAVTLPGLDSARRQPDLFCSHGIFHSTNALERGLELAAGKGRAP